MDRSTYLKQLKSGSLRGVYVFEGKEEYLKEQTLKATEAALLPEGFEALNEVVLDAPDIQRLYDSALAVPFLCDKRLVVAKDPAFLNEKRSSKSDKGKDEVIAKLSDLDRNNPT